MRWRTLSPTCKWRCRQILPDPMTLSFFPPPSHPLGQMGEKGCELCPLCRLELAVFCLPESQEPRGPWPDQGLLFCDYVRGREQWWGNYLQLDPLRPRWRQASYVVWTLSLAFLTAPFANWKQITEGQGEGRSRKRNQPVWVRWCDSNSVN